MSSPVKTEKPRPHMCTTCLRAFARLEHLKRHERSHTKEKPFQCVSCQRRFARRDLLLRHQQKLHADLVTTRQRQPRKNSITVAALSRPQKPTPRPRANTVGSLPTSIVSQADADSIKSTVGLSTSYNAAASTNSWLESTFGKALTSRHDDSSSRFYSSVTGTGDAIQPNLFGELYINPDLLPFTLPDNKDMGFMDEEALDFDADYWLGDLSLSSPNIIPKQEDDFGSPISYDTPTSVTSNASLSEDTGVNTQFSFPTQNYTVSTNTNANREPMSRWHMQTQIEKDNRSLAQFDCSTIAPSLLLERFCSNQSVDSLIGAEQPSPTPSASSMNSYTSNLSSLNTSIVTSSPPLAALQRQMSNVMPGRC
ncbi:hypothetical protein V1512DRAFT_254990 [Lipomyces arxii]|uniref:uncharacterized protein n=1 Tax=Lipomyces arxii TaxID=56418 RepID=UPI0034CF7E07